MSRKKGFQEGKEVQRERRSRQKSRTIGKAVNRPESIGSRHYRQNSKNRKERFEKKW